MRREIWREGSAKECDRRDKCTHGVARLETSLTIMSMPRFLATPICVDDQDGIWQNIKGTDFAVKSTEIDADDRHDGG